MFFVIFESTVPPTATKISNTYYTTLQPLLRSQPGFLSEVPFASNSDPDCQLVLATFIDEDAEHRWRIQPTHLRIQQKARKTVFSWYRVRVGPNIGGEERKEEKEEGAKTGQGQVMVLYQRSLPTEKGKAPEDVRSLVDPNVVSDVISTDLNDSAIYQGADSILWLSSWRNDAAAIKFEKSIRRTAGDSVQRVRIVRDYGKFDRKEAPGNENENVPAAEEDEGEDATGI